MSTPVSPPQPIQERLRELDAEMRINIGGIAREAAERIEELKARAEQAEQAVDVLESNAREQAKLLADTGRRVEELEAALHAVVQWFDDAGYIPAGFEANDVRIGPKMLAVFCGARTALSPSTPAVSR